MTLHAYLPQDRLRALLRKQPLPDRATGSALFADISGFTPLTEALGEMLGARRGAEEMTKHLSRIYNALIAEVERYGGSVIDFAGDSVMCWFDDAHSPAPPRAVRCALALQRVMDSFPAFSLPSGESVVMAVKVAVASGQARRFVVGDPEVNCMDVLAGDTVMRVSTGEHHAQKGEALADRATVDALDGKLDIGEWRVHSDSDIHESFAVIRGIKTGFDEPGAAPLSPPGLESQPPDLELKPWLHPAIYERERSGQESLTTEFRPCAALFVRFGGIDYDADGAGEQLNQWVCAMQAGARSFGGALLQLTIGDKGSYAYISIGALSMHEDDPRRAVKLALLLRDEARSLGFLSPLQIGVTQGTLFVGRHGSATRKFFGALGDDVNLAARFMTTASLGEILISGRVRKAVSEEFIVEARPPLTVKGKAEPLSVYSVLGAKQQRAVRLQEPEYALPMIGREKELAMISDKLALAVQGRGQILGVTGEAGLGKSRLVAEGIRLAHRGKLVGYGSVCKSDEVNTPYLVWNAVWNAFFDLDPVMPLRKQVRSIEAELADMAPDNLDAIPLLGSILGLPLPENDFTRLLQPKDRKSQLEALLMRCLEFAAREASESGGGLLLVLEDLHWIDPVSSNLLDLIARAVESLPILILLTYRLPEIDILDPGVNNLRNLGHFTEIRLTELNDAESEQIIRGKLSQLFSEQRSGVPSELIRRVIRRAQGNPFYLEEVLNFLHDNGVDPRDADAMTSFELPASLHSLILSRIDRLTPSQQLAFRVASVIGRVFRYDDLLSYYPWQGAAGHLKSDLQALVKADLISVESPEPDPAYLFRHLVIREVGYQNITYTARVQLHELYAHHLEHAHADAIEQITPQLAFHYDRAQSYDKAAYYLARSGGQAAAGYANEEALSYFNRALILLPAESDPRKRFDIIWKRERIYDLLGKRAEQRQDLTSLTRLAGQFEDAPTLRAQIFIRRAQLEIDMGDFASAKAHAQAAIREANADLQSNGAPPDLHVDALLLEVRAMFLAGQAIQAKPQLDDALALAREYRYLRGEYNALANLGLWNWYNGDNQTAADLMRQSLSLIRQAGDVRRESDILNNLGIVSKDMYRFDEALDHYRTARNIVRKIGDRSGEATLLNNMGRAGLMSGDYGAAIEYCAQSAALAAEVNDPAVHGLALHNRSEALRELGQYEAARKAADESLALMRSSGYKVGEANTLENIAMIELAQGSYPDALLHAGQALAIAREVASRRVEASVLTRIGMTRLETGEFDEAEKNLIEAQTLETELNEPILRFEILSGLARVASGRGEAEVSFIQSLLDEILSDPPTEQSHLLPLGLYLTGIRAMGANNNPDTQKLVARAKMELSARSLRIADAGLRASYMNIPHHRDIAALAGGESY